MLLEEARDSVVLSYRGVPNEISEQYRWLMPVDDEEYRMLYKCEPNGKAPKVLIGTIHAVSDSESPYYIYGRDPSLLGVLASPWEAAQYLIAKHEGLECPLVPWNAPEDEANA